MERIFRCLDVRDPLNIPRGATVCNKAMLTPFTLLQLRDHLPSSPEALLHIAAQINALAVSQQLAASKLEVEDLVEQLAERDREVVFLRGENESLQGDLEASDEVVSRLTAEKEALIESVRQLHRDVQQLEGFKRSLLQTLQEVCCAPG